MAAKLWSFGSANPGSKQLSEEHVTGITALSESWKRACLVKSAMNKLLPIAHFPINSSTIFPLANVMRILENLHTTLRQHHYT